MHLVLNAFSLKSLVVVGESHELFTYSPIKSRAHVGFAS